MSMYQFTSNAPLLAPFDHPTTLRAHARSIIVNTITTPFSRSASATFQVRRSTFNFNDSPSTLHPSRRSPSNQLQHLLPEQPLLKPAAGPA